MSMGISVEDDKERRLTDFSLRMDNFLEEKNMSACAFLHDEEIIIVVGNCDEKSIHETADLLLKCAEDTCRFTEEVFLGVGEIVDHAEKIGKSYHQASKIRKLREMKKLPDELMYYDELDVYKILIGIENNEILESFCDKTIGSLIEYDRKNDTALVTTLETYLNSDCSVKRTSEELFLHKNTINYQLRRIGEILGKNILSERVRLSLMLALMTRDLI